MYHYLDCGLSNVYLRNGYTEYETPYGKGVSIADLDGLHKAIGVALAKYKPTLTGKEVRFLRIELDFSQADLAKFLGVGETTIRGWEAGRTKITKPAERLLRALYKEHVCGDGGVRELVNRISQINREAHRAKLELENTGSGWKEAA